MPPELIFDTGLGELFVIRVAGNVFSPEIAGTLEYAGSYLGTPLFLVLGHEGCGAVAAALATKHLGKQFRSRVQLLLSSIVPGLPDRDPTLSIEEQASRAVESNVRWTVRQVLDSPEGKARLAEGRMKIVGAVYEIETGPDFIVIDNVQLEEGRQANAQLSLTLELSTYYKAPAAAGANVSVAGAAASPAATPATAGGDGR